MMHSIVIYIHSKVRKIISHFEKGQTPPFLTLNPLQFSIRIFLKKRYMSFEISWCSIFMQKQENSYRGYSDNLITTNY